MPEVKVYTARFSDGVVRKNIEVRSPLTRKVLENIRMQILNAHPTAFNILETRRGIMFDVPHQN